MTAPPDLGRQLKRVLLTRTPVLLAACGSDETDIVGLLRELAERAGRGHAVHIVGLGDTHRRDPSRIHPGHVKPALPDAAVWRGLPETSLTADWRQARADTLCCYGSRRVRRDPAWFGHQRRLAEPCGRRLSGRHAERLQGPCGDSLDPRPRLDLDRDFLAGGIVVLDTGTVFGQRYMLWLLLTAVQAWEHGRADAPIVIGAREFLDDLAQTLPDWRVKKVAQSYALTCDTDSLISSNDFRDAARWSEREAARSGLVRVDHTSGVWSAEGEGRHVFAIRAGCFDTYSPGQPDRHGLRLAEVTREGDLIGYAQTLQAPLSDADMAAAVRDAWHTGPRNLTIADRDLNAPHVDKTFPRWLRAGMIPEPAALALHGILTDLLGSERMRFFDALNGHRCGYALQLWARSGPDPLLRRQFVATSPSLAAMALDPEITRLVDARRSPLPRIRELLGCSPAIARRLSTVERCYSPMSDERDWRRLGTLLDALGHGHLPRADDSFAWYALECCALLIQEKLPLELGKDPRILADTMVRIPGRRWGERRQAIEAIPRAVFGEIMDFRASLLGWIHRMAGEETAKAVTRDILIGYGSLARLLEATQRWHALPALHLSGAGLSPEATWPVPFAPVSLPDGGEARVLGSMAELVGEGVRGADADGIDGLGHCVASYGPRCLDGRSLILAFRRVDRPVPERLSTLELEPKKDGCWRIAGQPYTERQHRGRENAKPSAEALVMAEGLRTLLWHDKVPLLPQTGRGVRLLIETDGLETLALWQTLLPPRWARLDPEAFVAAVYAVRGVAPAPPPAGPEGLVDLLDVA